MNNKLNVSDFFATKNVVKVFDDSAESGDYRLFCPEDKHLAQRYKDMGYNIASIHETINEDGDVMDEFVVLDNSTSEGFHKVGFFIYEN